MRSKLPYKTVAWLTIALFAPLAVLSVSGQVLCVGEDDHVQVESTIEACCDPGASDIEVCELLGDNEDPSDCGDCSDLHLDPVRSMRVRFRFATPQILAPSSGLVWSIVATPPASRNTRQVGWDEYLLALTPSRLSVSTAILIC